VEMREIFGANERRKKTKTIGQPLLANCSCLLKMLITSFSTSSLFSYFSFRLDVIKDGCVKNSL
jgi:hypothetical protein